MGSDTHAIKTPSKEILNAREGNADGSQAAPGTGRAIQTHEQAITSDGQTVTAAQRPHQTGLRLQLWRQSEPKERRPIVAKAPVHIDAAPL
jgi:hypothetical protein